jgi:hypothetical protein
MKFPIYKKSRLIGFPTYIMILSELECIEVCTDELKIQHHNNGLMSRHFLTDCGYEDTSASEFQMHYVDVRKEFTSKVTAPEILRLEKNKQFEIAS